MSFLSGIIDKFYIHFPRPIPDHEFKKGREGRIRMLVSQYSEGSIRLQAGQYVTKEQAAEDRKISLSYKF
jgi:hypothetical protein